MKGQRLLLPTLGFAVLFVMCAGTPLAGIYNRGGIPESTLRLSERELELPAAESGEHENTPLTLHLVWRVETAGHIGSSATLASTTPVTWITPSKLAQLGIAISSGVGPDTFASTLLVLEFDGRAHARAVLQACSLAGQTNDARTCEFEVKKSSRLYVVDAGRSLRELRERYSDRAHFAIVPGVIKLTQEVNAGEIAGYISSLSVETVQGIEPLRSAIDPATGEMLWRRLQAEHYFDAVICFGRRLEPWNVLVEGRESEVVSPVATSQDGREWEYLPSIR